MSTPNDNGELSPLLVVADADPSRRGELEELLARAGYRVRAVPDAPGLRAALAREAPAAVLVDPDLDAQQADLCRELRASLGSSATILALLTREELDRIDALCGAGADDVLELPPHPALLGHRVRQALRQAQALVAPLLTRPDDTAQPWERFLGELAVEVARAGGFEQKLAVLCVRATTDGDCDADFVTDLRAALTPADGASPERCAEGALVCADHGEGARALVLLPGMQRIQDAARVGGRLREALLASDGAYRDVDVGVAVFPTDGRDAQQLVDNARAAAESASLEGRSELRFHNEAMNRWSFERLALEQGLRDALERDELVVHYQPKLEIATRRIVGMEALVRWEHPRLGMISPAQFIPLAEETGLILPIGEWVLREACRQNREWHERGLPPMRMAVNLSPVQFLDPRLPEMVTEVLHEVAMDPGLLELELTEGMLMENVRTTSRRLGELKQSGIHLSVDDFGTGYSSLSYLRRFPIDTLKIDRSFVREVTSNSDDAAIVTSIILMGKSLKLSVIAEGVETESQLAFLEVLSCDQIQGYLISAPQSPAQMEAFVRGWDPKS